jgi:predicted acyltransferase
MVLAVFYELIEVRRCRVWCQPFVWIGSNAITIYLGSQIIGFQRLAARLVGGDVRTFFDSFVVPGFVGLVVALVDLLLSILFARFRGGKNLPLPPHHFFT